jgi:hypothetical protein
MDMIHDGASRRRLKTLPKLAIHGSTGLAAIVCAGLVGHFMMDSGASQLTTTPPATAQIYEVPDLDQVEDQAMTEAADASTAGDATANAEQPVAQAPIPPKPVAKPAIKAAAARSCDGGDCESWETIVNRALTAGPTAQYRPEPVRASAPNEAPRFDPYQTGAVAPAGTGMAQPMGRNIPPADVIPQDAMPQDAMPYDTMAQNEPPVIRREGPTSIGEMAKSATTTAAATVVTQSSKLVDNLMRWSENAVSGVGLNRD